MSRDPRTRDHDVLPPAALGTAVAILCSLLKTTRLAIHQVRAGRIECLYCSPDLTSQGERVWQERRRELLGGETVRADGIVYLPVVDGRVVGVLETADAPPDALDVFRTSLLACTLRVLPEVFKTVAAPTTAVAADTSGQVAKPSARRESDRESLGDARRVMRQALNEIEKVRLRTSLERHKWVVSAVARDMHVNRATIYRRMASVGIVRGAPSPKAPRHRVRARLLPRVP